MSSSRKPTVPSPFASGSPAHNRKDKPNTSGNNGGGAPKGSVAADIEKSAKNTAPSTSDSEEMWEKLPKEMKDKLEQLSKGQPAQKRSKMAATFLVKSMKEDKPIEANEKEIKTLVKLAGDDETLKEFSSKKKVIKSKDGKEVNLSSLLQVSGIKPVDAKDNKASTAPAQSTTVTDAQAQNKQDPKAATHASTTPVSDMKSESEFTELKKKFDDRGVELNEKDTEIRKMKDELQQMKDQVLKMNELTELLNEKGTALEKKDKEISEMNAEHETLCKKYDETIKDKDVKNKDLEQQVMTMHEEFKKLTEDRNDQLIKFSQCKGELEKAKRNIEYLKADHEDKMRHKDNQIKQIVADRDDLRHRFSKLAGAKLTDQNPDIADLSDPNRAMKLSEKFGGLYDDQWTDAFEELKGKKKMPVKDAIALLLDVLKKCEQFCYKLKDQQMDSLRNVLLHPAQDVASFGSEPRKHVGGFKEHARISSDDQKAVNVLRRQVNVKESVLEEVKQVFVMETKSWPEKKNLEGCLAYLQKCAEICWLMVLHDPPLYMKMDVERGEKLDPNLYSVYSASGNNIDFLVWPPLFNDKNGGLLSKGTAEAYKVVKK